MYLYNCKTLSVHKYANIGVIYTPKKPIPDYFPRYRKEKNFYIYKLLITEF